MAISPNTGVLERSHSKLAKICFKDRNRFLVKHIEIVYLLANHQIDGTEELFSAASLKLVNKRQKQEKSSLL